MHKMTKRKDKGEIDESALSLSIKTISTHFLQCPHPINLDQLSVCRLRSGLAYKAQRTLQEPNPLP
jgi:hypothetical protein